MNNPETYHHISFAIKESDKKYFFKHLETFSNYACAERKIPYQLVGKLYNLIHEIESIKDDKVYNNATALTDKAVKYFSVAAKGTYNFEIPAKAGFNTEYWETIDNNSNTKNKHYRLWDLFKNCALVYYRLREEGKIIDQKETLQLFYTEIKKFKNSFFNKKHKTLCNEYRMGTMAAYLTQHAGFRISTKKNPTNRDYYQASRNAINALKNKKPAKK